MGDHSTREAYSPEEKEEKGEQKSRQEIGFSNWSLSNSSNLSSDDADADALNREILIAHIDFNWSEIRVFGYQI